MLGGFDVRLGDTLITRFESRKVVALLARLSLFPRRSHAREELTELLWPEIDPEIGGNRLRHTLASLRRQLEPPGASPVLIADRHCIRLHPDAFASDVDDFETLLGKKRWTEAVALYRGDFLPGLYDEWIQEARERLTALYEGALEEAGAEPMPAKPAISPRHRLRRFVDRSRKGHGGLILPLRSPRHVHRRAHLAQTERDSLADAPARVRHQSDRAFEGTHGFLLSGTAGVALTPPARHLIILTVLRPKWWNGRHARLKSVWGNPWGFESPLRHRETPVRRYPLLDTGVSFIP